MRRQPVSGPTVEGRGQPNSGQGHGAAGPVRGGRRVGSADNRPQRLLPSADCAHRGTRSRDEEQWSTERERAQKPSGYCQSRLNLKRVSRSRGMAVQALCFQHMRRQR